MQERALMQAKGLNGILQLFPDRIRILRPGLIASLYERDRPTDLLLGQIQKIEFKHTVGGLGGYIAFHDDEGREDFEDFCVSFLKLQEHSFEAIKKAIEEQRAAILAEHAKNKVEILKD
ncbi:MAG TPA: hypothetical protein VFB38_13635 [Chthonomonadaceae bacterium]|nr:hypothetical protein [Chthonomonadaceae bacterium]